VLLIHTSFFSEGAGCIESIYLLHCFFTIGWVLEEHPVHKSHGHLFLSSSLPGGAEEKTSENWFNQSCDLETKVSGLEST